MIFVPNTINITLIADQRYFAINDVILFVINSLVGAPMPRRIIGRGEINVLGAITIIKSPSHI